MGIEKLGLEIPLYLIVNRLKIEAIRSHGRVWKYKGEAFVGEKNGRCHLVCNNCR